MGESGARLAPLRVIGTSGRPAVEVGEGFLR
jgi:hypothetical protein